MECRGEPGCGAECQVGSGLNPKAPIQSLSHGEWERLWTGRERACAWEAGLVCAGHRGAAVSPTSQMRAGAGLGVEVPWLRPQSLGIAGLGLPPSRPLSPRGGGHPAAPLTPAQAWHKPFHGLVSLNPRKTLRVRPQRSPASPAGRLPCHPSCQNSQEAGARIWTLACLTSKSHLCPELLPKAF